MPIFPLNVRTAHLDPVNAYILSHLISKSTPYVVVADNQRLATQMAASLDIPIFTIVTRQNPLDLRLSTLYFCSSAYCVNNLNRIVDPNRIRKHGDASVDALAMLSKQALTVSDGHGSFVNDITREMILLKLSATVVEPSIAALESLALHNPHLQIVLSTDLNYMMNSSIVAALRPNQTLAFSKMVPVASLVISDDETAIRFATSVGIPSIVVHPSVAEWNFGTVSGTRHVIAGQLEQIFRASNVSWPLIKELNDEMRRMSTVRFVDSAKSIVHDIIESIDSKAHEKLPFIIPLDPSTVALVTYFAPKTNSQHRVHVGNDVQAWLSNITLNTIAAYANQQGMPFFYQNQFLIETEVKSPYWSKMDVVSYYLDKGFEWAIWTDIDVVFQKTQKSLIKAWIEPARDKHIALVLECNGDSPMYFSSVRSGFLAFRNTPEARSFINHWKSLHNEFANNWNPDQEALELMVTQSPWREMAYIAKPDGIHTYMRCYNAYDKDVISVHFPGHEKGMIGDFTKQVRKTMFNDFAISTPWTE